ncbi:membrane integrity-associated transporter subunit PqiC [bacterium]|nr:membrane integrity-associated transporter subunit PqiC [bacterium]
MKRTLILLAAALVLTGCLSGVFKREAITVNYYQIEYPEIEKVCSKPYDLALSFRRLTVNSAYDRSTLIYMNGDKSGGVYKYDEWLSSPDELIFSMLQRDLEDGGVFKNLTSRTSGVLPDYSLQGTLVEVYENRELLGAKAKAHAVMLFTLTRLDRGANASRVILQKRYTADSDCASGDADSYVQGVCASIREISSNLNKDILTAVTEEETRLKEQTKE